MAKTFHYCGSWGTWSRVLSADHPQGPYIEVNLTPIPCCHNSTWDNDVRPIRIRAHGTPRDYIGYYPQDKETDELPDDVRAAMVRNLGPELTERLLTEDFLPLIDWDLYRQKTNGGANFDDIRSLPAALAAVINDYIVEHEEKSAT